ncbi:MAG TPA: hypothetical protein VFL91_24445, partial [Thermomicrobiales bacterium]|nr:hypothetical protein [Thermomicrobiales bacterium]
LSATFAIHYSCESFVDKPNGYSPRISTIAVKSLGSGQTRSFSIYSVAEMQGTPKNEVERHYDQIEREMLNDFFRFLKQHGSNYFVHWNMRDANYGFQALYNRYRVLGGTPVTLDEAKLLDLASALVDIYGHRYVEHPRLENLILLNGFTRHTFLTGAEEAQAFENKEYLRLQRSTLRKVDCIAELLMLQLEGKLKTKARRLPSWVTTVYDHPVSKAVFIVSAIVSIVAFFFAVITYLH